MDLGSGGGGGPAWDQGNQQSDQQGGGGGEGGGGGVVGLAIRQVDVTAYYVVLWTLWQPILHNGGWGIHVEIFISCDTIGLRLWLD